MRVLQVTPNLLYGGAERLVADLAPRLLVTVGAVEVATNLDLDGGFRPLLESAGVPLVHVPLRARRASAVPSASRALAAVVRRFEPDVIHAHNPAAGTVSALARMFARRRQLAIVVTYHGVRPHRLRAAAATLRLCDLVIAVGPGAERQLVSVLPADRVRRIDNAIVAVPRREFEEVRREFVVDGSPLLLSVGRLVHQKDHGLLLDALAILRARGVAARTIVIGRGPLEETLREQARRLDLGDSLLFAGTRSDVADVMAAADLVVHTAAWEGLPLVLLEAMMLGKPIVAVEAVGVTDLITDGATGRLVRSRDPGAVADAIEEMLAHRELRESLAAGAKRWATVHCSIERFVDAHVDAYREASNRRRGIRGQPRAVRSFDTAGT